MTPDLLLSRLAELGPFVSTDARRQTMRDAGGLVERLEKASGQVDAVTAAGWANDLSPWATNSEEWSLFIKALGSGLDAPGAALALVAKALPGWSLRLYIHPNETHGELYLLGDMVTDPVVHRLIVAGPFEAAQAPTPPLAILLALCRALSKGTDHE